MRAVLRRAEPDADDEIARARRYRPRRAVPRRSRVAGDPVELTGKEFDLLASCSTHPGIVVSRERLLERVWGLTFPAGRGPWTSTSPSCGRKLDRPELIRHDPRLRLQGRRHESPCTGRARCAARLFVGDRATVAVVDRRDARWSARCLTRRSLERRAHQLARAPGRPDRRAARRASPLPRRTPDRSLPATEQERLAILTPEQAELLLPVSAAATLRATGTRQRARSRFAASRSSTQPGSAAARRSCCSAPRATSPPTGRRSSSGWRSQPSSARRSQRSSPSCSRAPSRARSRASRPPAGASPRARARAAPVEGADEVRQLSDCVQPSRGGLAPRTGCGARVPALRQPRAEDAADRDPRPCRGRCTTASSSADRGRRRDRARGQRLERLIRDLLDLARLRRRSFDVTPSPSTSVRSRRDAVARHAFQAAGHGVELDARGRRSGRARSPTPAARCRRSRISSRTRSAARRAGGSVEIVAAAGELDVVDDGPGLASRTTSNVRSSASTSGIATAPTARSGRDSGSRSLPSSRRRWEGASPWQSTPDPGRCSRSSCSPPPCRINALRTAYAALKRPRTRRS